MDPVKAGGPVMSVPRTVCGVLLYLLAAVGAAAGSAPLDETAIRAKLAPCLCRVTVQNAWGVPLALANGFVLGNGRFVVTELGALARPGGVRAVMRFQDGSEVASNQFGLADPVSGLAALYLKPGVSSREGLALALELPPLAAGPTVATMGREEGSELEPATGRLVAGPRMNELAARTGVSVLKADWTFLRIARRGVVGTSGMPVLDGEGTVLGVRIDVVGRGVTAPLVVPATTLRAALLASERELKPLTELPKAAWAVPILRLEGRPVTAPEFGRLARDLKDSLVCKKCNGRGSFASSSYSSLYSYIPTRVTCKACGGDGIACVEGVYAKLAEVAEECTRVAWAPGIEARARKAILTEGIQRLKKLAGTGRQFQRAWAAAAAADAGFPRGIVIYARAGETIDGPDGRYTRLEAAGSRKSLIFRAGAVTNPSAPGPVGAPAEPKKGTWIVLGGVAQTRIGPAKRATKWQPRRGGAVYVLPFGWVPAPPAAVWAPTGRGTPGRGTPRP